jgi:glucose-6-phosphate 1-dehydrogenase
VARVTAPAAVFVVFGATGDLARRKILPALFRLHHSGAAFECHVLGVTRAADVTDESFRRLAREALADDELPDDAVREWAEDHLHYQPINAGTPADFQALADRIAALERERGLPGNRVFYVALPPAAFGPTIESLAGAGLSKSAGWTRLVVEKPFGRDLASAEVLNALIHRHFDESQVYRIDHYLGKETVQNLLVFRFANTIFESQWNRDHVESVQITVAEDLGIEGRSEYYDSAGAIRDMIQNHLTQLVSLVAMEVPGAINAEAIRFEKVKALRAIRPIEESSVVAGQYAAGRIDDKAVPGYTAEPGVAKGSTTETFVALRLEVDTWRWQGVPFVLRTGKRMPRRLTEIVINFRQPPVCLFEPFEACHIRSDTLVLRVQPDEGFILLFDVKAPGSPFRLERQPLHFNYSEAFGELPEAYETLLLDVLEGDQTLFVHADEVEQAWRLYTPLLGRARPVHPYTAGSWGPAESHKLMPGAVKWRNP